MSQSVEHVLIVGAGLAGLRTAEELRRAGYAGEITLLGDENRAPYDRPPLSKQYMRGETDDTALRPAEFFTERRIRLRLGVTATGVDTAARRVRLSDDTETGYDALVIATGLRPRRIPNLPEVSGVHVLRSHADAAALRDHLGGARKAVIVGAGFIGCELAASFRARDLDVTIVEPQPTPLFAALGEQVGALVARLHEAEGVAVRCGIGVESLVTDGDSVSGVRLADGGVLDADLVVIGIGSVPVTGWLEGSGIPLATPADGGGVLADGTGQTAVPGVWAVGDVAAWPHATGGNRRVEHWTNAGEQARTLAAALLGTEATAEVQVPYVWSDQYDMKIQVLGVPALADEIRIVEDQGRKFLAHYLRTGELVAVVGASMVGKVMKARAELAANLRPQAAVG
ncbi:NAD(P)/FAD-dependent oxidoreductase [Nocardia seriolae]|uniref:NAD(P)/FAD-dependent oxidoreductase n=1 Tax=Nocardia seriolae TaxID=37332 RepID=UPI0004B1F3A5|nr:FAD/NAD(P)-binding oxidoreductase [Nocardia seriolae]MTJ60688.1 FAD-dependent oxidoreductase [Nocardia seriolae]MTJ76030.1 FAD-dependent oxidoreductase [Nocardia seriolae]MTJ91164.1 FAD-dependent oxidoreductase [Nocardia seriolae]MTK35125.1 FAD-dependent oxidoreductase [Nocardia seriolae]MTK38677.1 FAD-dependent oxidoreductase [Nocardia seriolae]